MPYATEEALERQSPRAAICLECLTDSTEDTALLALAEGNTTEPECRYCQRRRPSASFNLLCKRVMKMFHKRYDLADEELPYDSGEGGFQGLTFSTPDLLNEHFISSHGFARDLVRVLPDYTWCEKDPFGLPRDQALRYSWDAFSQLVRHEQRFMFFQHIPSDGDLYAPLELFSALEDLIERHAMFVELTPAQVVYRVRLAEDYPRVLHALVTPPDQYTTHPNRMNPPGIGMLYAALDEDIAILETLRPSGVEQPFVLAQLRVRSPVRLVDLSRVAAQRPSFFDLERADDYQLVPFLRRFIEEISQPIDPRVAPFKYVPTQILTEFFRHGARFSSSIDGLQFRSARNEVGQTKPSLVLFMNHKRSVEDLELIGTEERVLPASV